MMTDFLSYDPYYVFTSTAHALRRHAEIGSLAMGATFGVAADPLTFQLATVRRVLTDLRIRHLIADEVGLGKTIQSIMILSALRARNPDHRTVLVAPERLLGQWHEELWTRGHIVGHIVTDEDRAQMRDFTQKRAESTESALPKDEAKEYLTERFSEASVLLLRPRDITEQPTWLDPSTQNMLLIDEPQSIPRSVLSQLQLVSNEENNDSPAFRQLLILSATPRLADPYWRDQFFEFLEPTRVRLARDAAQDPSLWFEEVEKNEAQKLIGLPYDKLIAEGEISFNSHARTRRISRQTRADWGEYFPRRENHVKLFTPNASECGRIRLISSLLEESSQSALSTTEGQPWTAISGLLRSRRTVRTAIDRLERPPSEAEAVRRDALLDFGDSRLDALLDVLSGIIGAKDGQALARTSPKNPEKIVIVAGDTPTIDMLIEVLPRYFPELLEGGITALRRSSAASESSFEDIKAMHEAITPFVSGTARILLLGDWVQAGLNLQHSARNMIFYSTPWDPQAVDQLIGRIDRISKNSIAAVRKGHGHKGIVRIWRLVMRCSLEEGLSDAMDALGVYNAPLPQASDEVWAEINCLIANILSRPDQMASLQKLRDLTENWHGRGFESRFDHFNPLTKDNIIARNLAIGEIAATCAIRGEEQLSSIDKIEIANRDWLFGTGKAGGFTFFEGQVDRSPFSRRYEALWYASRQTQPPFEIEHMKKDNARDDKLPILINRRKMTSPPSRTVLMNDADKSETPLRFFDHGEVLHDELVRRWLEFGAPRFQSSPDGEILVKVNSEHPALAWEGRTIVLSIGCGESITAASTGISEQSDEAPEFTAQFQEGIEADIRWLTDLVPTQFMFRASVQNNDNWEEIETIDAAVLLRSRPDMSEKSVLRSKRMKLRTSVKTCSAEHSKAMTREFQAYRKSVLLKLPTTWAQRYKVMKNEAENKALVYENRADRRALVTGPEAMAPANIGRVNADRRRAKLTKALLEARADTTSKTIASIAGEKQLFEMHVCLRFIKVDNS